jgi:hypothetical protein
MTVATPALVANSAAIILVSIPPVPRFEPIVEVDTISLIDSISRTIRTALAVSGNRRGLSV